MVPENNFWTKKNDLEVSHILHNLHVLNTLLHNVLCKILSGSLIIKTAILVLGFLMILMVLMVLPFTIPDLNQSKVQATEGAYLVKNYEICDI